MPRSGFSRGAPRIVHPGNRNTLQSFGTEWFPGIGTGCRDLRSAGTSQGTEWEAALYRMADCRWGWQGASIAPCRTPARPRTAGRPAWPALPTN